MEQTELDKLLYAIAEQYTNGAITSFEFALKVALVFNEHSDKLKEEQDAAWAEFNSEVEKMNEFRGEGTN